MDTWASGSSWGECKNFIILIWTLSSCLFSKCRSFSKQQIWLYRQWAGLSNGYQHYSFSCSNWLSGKCFGISNRVPEALERISRELRNEGVSVDSILFLNPIRNEYVDRVQSQRELAKMAVYCLENKKFIDFNQFKTIVEEVSSEMFLCVQC